MFLKDLVEKNGDKIVRYDNCREDKKYMSVFNYSEKYGGTFDGFKYYNDYIIELWGKQESEKLWEIIKINKDHNNEYILEMEHGLIDSRMLMILLRSGYTMEIYNDNMLRFKVV